MGSDLTRQLKVDASFVSRLACPACLGDLRLDGTRPDEMRLVCSGCGRGYPIVDGIPVLIAGREDTQD